MDPTERDLDHLARRFSQEMSDDEVQLNELGSSIFSTAKLLEMRGRYIERLQQFDFWQRLLIKAALWSPLLLVVGSILLWFRIIPLGWMFITAFPVLFVMCLLSVFLMYRRFGIRKKTEHWLEEIENELTKRRAIR